MQRPTFVNKRFIFWGLFFVVTGCWSIATWGQNNSSADAAGQGSPGPAGNDLLVSVQHPVIEAIEEEGAESVSDVVDDFFGTTVEALEKVLFFPVFTSDSETIEFREVHYYYRLVDSSTTDFERLRAAGDTAPLTSEDVQTGILVGEYDQNKITEGILKNGNDQDPGLHVEFVSHTVNTQKYQWSKKLDRFVALAPMLQQLNESNTLTKIQVEQAFLAGHLLLDDKGQYKQIQTKGIPFVVLWLACGAVFFTIYMRGFNLWGFRHAIQVVRGKYDNPDEDGEVTHMQALSSALSATVGLGNIAGVTIAMSMGGPGAFFWMLACGFFGMTTKFVECTLGQKFRKIKADGSVLGGPMAYLPEGLKRIGLGPLGVVLGFMFTIMCIMGSFGGGNMFQSNQAGVQLLTVFQQEDSEQLTDLNAKIKQANDAKDNVKIRELDEEKNTLTNRMAASSKKFKAIYGLVMAVMVGGVIIGGIKSIGSVAAKIVPAMCLIYVLACLFIIFRNMGELPALVGMIFTEAFSPKAFGGGMVGVLIIGVQRAAFSNEAGVGSAAIVHSAAKTNEPIREGAVALLEPFIDTIVVCSMTALVILITGAWNNTEWIVDQELAGTALTSRAFASEISWFPYILTIAVVLFAYSTMISWSYYGERCWETLLGSSKVSVFTYKILFVLAVFIGATAQLGTVLDFSDMMILCMAFPNIFGLILLSPGIRRDLRDYWKRFKNGEFRENP